MADISEQEIRVFVDAVSNFFFQTTHEKADIKAAFLANGDVPPPTFDFTGLIQISGAYRGCIYFSAPRPMLSKLLLALREPHLNDDNLLDVVGEIANTIAGNARKHFGETMEISVPRTLSGTATQLQQMIRARPFVIMITWRQFNASVVVDITSVANGKS